MIRFVIGFLMVIGGLGNIEVDPEASLVINAFIAALGIGLMFLGAEKLSGK